MEQIKTASAGFLLQQVQSRFKINNSNWRADALDFIGLIVEEIGYHTGYKRKAVQVEISNYKAKMPREIVTIGNVEYNGFPLAIASEKDSMITRRTGLPNLKSATSEDIMALNKESKRLKELQDLYLISPSEEILDSITDSQRKINLIIKNTTFNQETNSLGCDWFEIDGGYIKTSFESGCIIIDADVFQVDAEGLPLVVDTFKYREACVWGILYHTMLQGYVHPVITLAYAEGQKDYYVGRAQNEPKMMSIERHQRFTEHWSSLARGVHNETLNNL